jgi:hypothetical protein
MTAIGDFRWGSQMSSEAQGGGKVPDRGDERAGETAQRPGGEEELERQQEQVMRLVRHAGESWAEAMKSHIMAPPDAGFAGRLRRLAQAAATEQVAWEQAQATGLLWRPVPGAERAEPPYELRPGTGRRGPADLWRVFDAAVERLNRAIAGSSSAEVARAFGELARAAAALAEAVEREDALVQQAQQRAWEAQQHARRAAAGNGG